MSWELGPASTSDIQLVTALYREAMAWLGSQGFDQWQDMSGFEERIAAEVPQEKSGLWGTASPGLQVNAVLRRIICKHKLGRRKTTILSKPPKKPSRYAEVAAELRAAIISGQSAPDTPLPSEDRLAARHGVSRVTIRAALALLRSEGLITTVTGGATYIRDRRPVRLSMSRYARTLHPGPPGPFSAAAQAAGLVGHVQVIRVERHPADADTAQHLDITEGDEVIVRIRHMRLGDIEPETVQVSTSTIPLALVEGSPLAADTATRVHAAFVELGITPTTEEVTTRMPTP